jgi:hypothetical protein
VPETVCAGWQAITSTRDGVSRQYRFGRGNDEQDRFALASIDAVEARSRCYQLKLGHPPSAMKARLSHGQFLYF